MDVNRKKFNLNLIKLVTVLYCHTLFFKRHADMGKDKTDVLHFPDGFWIHQRTIDGTSSAGDEVAIDEYNNLQIPKGK